MFDEQQKLSIPALEVKTSHARGRIAEVADRDPQALAPAYRSLPDDLCLLERYVLGEVEGRMMTIHCHQLSKRLSRDFAAIEAELLPSEEIERRREARERGERRRHGRAKGYRWALGKGIPPR